MESKTNYYIGIDVGTGSARACIIDDNGDIVSLASEDISLWTPQQEHYVRIAISLNAVSTSLMLDINPRNNRHQTSGNASAQPSDEPFLPRTSPPR